MTSNAEMRTAYYDALHAIRSADTLDDLDKHGCNIDVLERVAERLGVRPSRIRAALKFSSAAKRGPKPGNAIPDKLRRLEWYEARERFSAEHTEIEVALWMKENKRPA